MCGLKSMAKEIPFLYLFFLLIPRFFFLENAWCLKITEKVSFYIASEASYFYILSGLKFIENAKMANLASFFNPEAYGQRMVPDRSLLKGRKLVENVIRKN